MIEMSVIVMTPDRYASIRQTMDYLRAQTVRDRLEILLVTPSADRLELDNTVRGDFGAVRVIEVGQLNSTAEARATAICATTAPIVALTEDHSFPEPMWAEALIQAHRQAWAVVGPTAINANPASATSWANFAIEYAEWMDPAPGGVAAHLPGHNSAYKREVLLQYGDALGQWLDAESVLHWDLRAKGYALYLEPSAKIRHWNFSRLLPSLSLRFDCARLFACARARQWSFFPLSGLHRRRAAYSVGAIVPHPARVAATPASSQWNSAISADHAASADIRSRWRGSGVCLWR